MDDLLVEEFVDLLDGDRAQNLRDHIVNMISPLSSRYMAWHIKRASLTTHLITWPIVQR